MDYLFPVHENRHEPVAAICYKLQAADVIQPDFAIPNHGSSQNNNDWQPLKPERKTLKKVEREKCERLFQALANERKK